MKEVQVGEETEVKSERSTAMTTTLQIIAGATLMRLSFKAGVIMSIGYRKGWIEPVIVNFGKFEIQADILLSSLITSALYVYVLKKSIDLYKYLKNN